LTGDYMAAVAAPAGETNNSAQAAATIANAECPIWTAPCRVGGGALDCSRAGLRPPRPSALSPRKRSSSERRRDSNPPDLGAGQRTLQVDLSANATQSRGRATRSVTTNCMIDAYPASAVCGLDSVLHLPHRFRVPAFRLHGRASGLIRPQEVRGYAEMANSKGTRRRE